MMRQLFTLAWRDLGRNRRRTFFSMLALAVGVALLLFMAAFVAGEIRGALQNSIDLQSGHVQVWAAGYDRDKSSLDFADLIAEPGDVAARVAALPQVRVATPRLYATGIVVAGDTSAGVRLIGIDPASDANAPFRDGLLAGAYLTADDRGGLLVGQTLANKLGLAPGSTLTLMVNTSNGDVDQQTFTVRGVYTTGTPGYDESTIFLPLAKAQAIARAEGHASAIFVLLHNQDDTQAVADALQSPGYRVETYLQQNELMVQFESFANTYMALFYLIVLAITATVIVNTLVMSVFERTREIGILAAMGMKRGRIMAMFFAESSLLALGGIGLGLVAGTVLALIMAQTGFYLGDYGVTGILIGERIYPYLTAGDAVNLTVMALAVTLIASLYPALVAANVEPVTALRSEK